MANSNIVQIILKVISEGADKAAALGNTVADGMKTGKKSVDAFNDAVGNGRQMITGFNDTVTGMVKAFLSLEAARMVLTGVVGVLKEADQANFSMASSVKAAAREFANTGSLEYWGDAVKDLSKELVVYSESALKGAISRTVDMTKRLGLSAEQMREVIKRTADLGAGKVDLQGAIERVTSALRGEAEASEYLGLTLNENYVKAWYEAHEAHATAWKDLDDTAKALVRFRVFLEQTNEAQGRAAEYSKTFGGALMFLHTTISDTITKNKDLATSMAQFGEFIRDNAETIGSMAADLVSAAAAVAQFAIEWKGVIAALIATYAAVRTTTTLFAGLAAAMAAIEGTAVAASLTGVAAAAQAVLITGGALTGWLGAGLALAAVYAMTSITGLIQALQELEHWEEVTGQATADRAKIEQQANEKARELGARLGMNITTLAEFNRLVKDGKIIQNAATGEWEKATRVLNAQSRQLELTEEKFKELKDAVKEVGSAYESLSGRIGSAYDFVGAKAKAMATSEKSGVLAALEVQRQKTKAILDLANQEAAEKRRLVEGSGAGEAQQAELIKAIAQQVKDAKVQAIEGWKNKLRDALLWSLGEEKRYAAEVKKLQQELRDARASYSDKVRDLQRRTMSAEDQWLDKQKQATETLDKAMSALARAKSPEGLKEAGELAKKAMDQAAGLAGEVKEGEQVIKSEADTVNAALGIMQQAETVIEKSISKQADLAKEAGKRQEEMTKEIQGSLDKAQELQNKLGEIDSMTVTPTARIDVDSREVDRKLADLDGKVTHSTHIIHVQTVQENRLGGLIQAFAAGGWNRVSGLLPGWGGGDRVRALLEDGEFVIRKEAVAKYGAGLFHLLNNLRIDIPRLMASIMPRLPEVPQAAFAAGGPVTASDRLGITGGTASPPSSETLLIRFQAGDSEYPVQIHDLDSRKMMKNFARALEKMRLTRGA
jgi:hypothetical protein